MKRRKKGTASPPGTPPRAHARVGLKEINFHVEWPRSIIGPRKFRGSKFFNRPVPNIHERGGVAIAAGFRRVYAARYPERSFMWSAVQSLKRKNKIERRFNVTLRGSW